MRRKHLAALVLATPLVNGFSLNDFQPIDSILIPTLCLRTYNSDISFCTADDFNFQCSRTCQLSLRNLENIVGAACSGLLLNPSSLLGIIKNGGIISALCPPQQTTTTKQAARPTTSAKPPPQTTPETTEAPPTRTTAIEETSSTTTSTPETTQETPTSTLETTPETTTSPSTTTEVEDPSTTEAPVSTTNIKEDPSTSRSTASPKTTAASDENNGSGGGSPFDIVAGDASKHVRGSLLSISVLGVWGFILLAR